MKLKYLAAVFLAAVCMIFSAPAVFAADFYFEDGADFYDDTDEAYVRSMLKEASEHTGWNYGLVTEDKSYSSTSSAGRAAEEIYNREFGEDSSGLLYFGDRNGVYIVVAGEARDYVVGSRFDNMLKKIKTDYFKYRDLQCAKTFTESTMKYYDKGVGNFDFYIPTLIVSILLGALAAWGTAYGITHTYTTHEKPSTNNYLDVRKVDIYRRGDQLLHMYTRRVDTRSHHYGGGGYHGGGGFGGSHGGGGFRGHR